jgi:prevent-host-death family protein
MKRVALAEVKDHLSEFLRDAANEGIVITRHGRPAGVLIGFADDDDWFDYQLENDPRFLARVEQARQSLRAGAGVPWEDVQADPATAADGIRASDKPRAAKSRARVRKPE